MFRTNEYPPIIQYFSGNVVKVICTPEVLFDGELLDLINLLMSLLAGSLFVWGMAFFSMLASEVVLEVIGGGAVSVGTNDLGFVVDAGVICCYWLCLFVPKRRPGRSCNLPGVCSRCNCSTSGSLQLS